ncbi:ribonuclease P protein component [Nocardioides sp. GXQ0305]|uniref:ribonuclease P protein component n=1 Tax=Nocardioides sp. GXQ0305 TaxID=3423912 RepID=UPI003D7C9C49
MLPAAHRLTSGRTFRSVIRDGRRAGSRTLVVHLATDDGPREARVGMVVSRAVGNSVVRHRVQRRLRHLVREHLASLPDFTVLVVRATPAAGTASSRELGTDLGRCLQRVMS